MTVYVKDTFSERSDKAKSGFAFNYSIHPYGRVRQDGKDGHYSTAKPRKKPFKDRGHDMPANYDKRAS